MNRKKESWVSIHRELKDALDTWTELTDEAAGKPDPEQEKVAKVKRLLEELQIKIREF